MPLSRIEDLLGVKWFDGLVVNSQHLTHSDRRVARLLAEISQAGLDQAGLLTGESPGGTPSQLIQMESAEPAEGGQNVSAALTRSFVAAVPSGKIVVGYADKAHGMAALPLTIQVSPAAGTEDILICVRQEPDENVKLQQNAEGAATIDLIYPGLHGVALSHDDYKERLVGDYADYVAIASMTLATGSPVLDQQYIPPVLKLRAANAFDDGLVPKISAHWDELFRVVAEMVDAAGAAFAAGKAGADLMSRRTDYEALRTVLLCTWGIGKNIGGTSPTRLLFEGVQPIATWWDYHRARHFANVDLENQQSPVAAVSRLAQSLTAMTRRDLCAGSGRLLAQTNEFLAGLKNVLAVG